MKYVIKIKYKFYSFIAFFKLAYHSFSLGGNVNFITEVTEGNLKST